MSQWSKRKRQVRETHAQQTGSVTVDVGADTGGGKVVIKFNRAVAWFALSPDDAHRLCSTIMDAADEVDAAQSNPQEAAIETSV